MWRICYVPTNCLLLSWTDYGWLQTGALDACLHLGAGRASRRIMTSTPIRLMLLSEGSGGQTFIKLEIEGAECLALNGAAVNQSALCRRSHWCCSPRYFELPNANQANLGIVLLHAHESQVGMAKELIAASKKIALYCGTTLNCDRGCNPGRLHSRNFCSRPDRR
jgi:hypothetical protein